LRLEDELLDSVLDEELGDEELGELEEELEPDEELDEWLDVLDALDRLLDELELLGLDELEELEELDELEEDELTPAGGSVLRLLAGPSMMQTGPAVLCMVPQIDWRVRLPMSSDISYRVPMRNPCPLTESSAMPASCSESRALPNPMCRWFVCLFWIIMYRRCGFAFASSVGPVPHITARLTRSYAGPSRLLSDISFAAIAMTLLLLTSGCPGGRSPPGTLP
jgi:hypothetical protein